MEDENVDDDEDQEEDLVDDNDEEEEEDENPDDEEDEVENLEIMGHQNIFMQAIHALEDEELEGLDEEDPIEQEQVVDLQESEEDDDGAEVWGLGGFRNGVNDGA